MKRLRILISVVVTLVLFAHIAVTCPVCFGAAESGKTTESVNMAVMVLLGITGVVLSLLGAFFAYLRKRLKVTLDGTFNYPNLN